MVHATSEALSLLINAGPRRIDRWSDKPPILVFTDGAVEEGANKVTHGALLLDPVNQHSLVFGDHVPQMFVNAWMRFGKRQVIAQTEIFPVLVAKETWANVLAGRSVLWFLDNESAKMALIRIFLQYLIVFSCFRQMQNLTLKRNRRTGTAVFLQGAILPTAYRLEFGEHGSSVKCEPCYTKVTSTFFSFRVATEVFGSGK